MLFSSIFRVALSTDFFKTMQAYAFLVFLQELYDVYIIKVSVTNVPQQKRSQNATNVC
jgi:hypothetical protein